MAEEIYRLQVIQNILRWRRAKRIHFILSKVQTWPGMSVLDVGCGSNGRSFEDIVSEDYRITGIDLHEPHEVVTTHPLFHYYKQDARDLSRFEADTFDLAISVGMMEHICDRSVLEQMAREIARVARQWIIIVPWRYCWIEPHFKFPFFPLLPERTQKGLTKLLNLHNLRKAVQKDSSYIRSHYQWLSTREWMKIFKSKQAYILPPIYDVIAVVKTSGQEAAQGTAAQPADRRSGNARDG